MIGYFEEEAGIKSFSRLASAAVLVFTFIWVTYLVYVNKEIPSLTGPIGLLGITYGVNKATEAVSNLKGGSQIADKIK